MGADEEATVRDLKAHQTVILPIIGEHSGRIIDTAGDGILAEFANVLNAMRCALAIQDTMTKRNEAHRSKQCARRNGYSITSSARATSVGGTSRPRALAALRLTMSVNLVGCSTGSSPGRAPLRIRST